MVVTERGLIPNIFCFRVVKKNGGKLGTTSRRLIMAKKRDLEDNSRKQQKNPSFPLGVSIPKNPSTFLAQSAIGVFGLGFIDAGYSGDWSRIGVITKENEELLKLAAFVVVPFCIFLILSLSKKQNEN